MPYASIQSYDGRYFTSADGSASYQLLVEEGTMLLMAVSGSIGASRLLTIAAGQRNTGFDFRLGVQHTVTSPPNFVRIGWNLVSLPAAPVDPRPTVVFSGINVAASSLQYWDCSREGGGYIGYGLEWTGPLLVGSCYWFTEGTSAKTLSYSGYENLTDFTISFPEISGPRWVMFGHPFEHRTPCSAIRFTSTSQTTPVDWPTATALGLVEPQAAGYEANNQHGYFSVGASGVVDRTVLEPWYGYWLLLPRGERVNMHIPVLPAAP